MLANVTVSSQLEATLAARIEMAKLAQGEGDCKGYENGMRWQQDWSSRSMSTPYLCYTFEAQSLFFSIALFLFS